MLIISVCCDYQITSKQEVKGQILLRNERYLRLSDEDKNNNKILIISFDLPGKIEMAAHST